MVESTDFIVYHNYPATNGASEADTGTDTDKMRINLLKFVERA